MKITTLYIIFIGIFLGSCSPENEELVKRAGNNKANETKLFTLLSKEESGFYFKNEVNQSEEFNVISYEYFYNGGGVGIGDVNNDGLPDLFLTGNTFGGRLYLNKGGLKFEQISESANIFKPGFTTDVSFVDINNDGFQDIYLCRSLAGEAENRANVLYINNKDNTFTDQAEEYGVADSGFSNQSVFFDYDNDGDLDLYVMNHRADFDNALTIYDTKQEKGNYGPDSQFWKDEYSDKLYRNNGDKTFTDVSVSAGIRNNDFSLSAVPADLNNDGLTDLYIANDFSSKDHAYINQGNGKFIDDLEDRFGHIPLNSMGVDIADYNNDGYPDIVNLDMTPEGNYRQKQLKGANPYDKHHMAVDFGFHHQIARNMLQLNNGDGTFSEVGQLTNMAYTDWSWGSLFADFNNDGWQDLYIANGHYKDITDLDYLKYRSMEAVEAAGGNDHVKAMELINLMTSTKISNYMYMNNGNLGFDDKSNEWGLDQPSHSNGTAYADLDLDGDLDLIVNNFNQDAFLYRNNSRELNKDNYLSIVLKGGEGNPQGFGAKVKISTNSGNQHRECTPYRGFLSSVDPTLHFGLGKTATISELQVIWPNGKMQTLKNISANQRLVVSISDANENHQYSRENNNTLLTKSNGHYNSVHVENEFIDFKKEPLLEHMMSNKGPVITKGDVNGDGLLDIYLGGSAGYPGKLLIQKTNESFVEKQNSTFDSDKAFEDGGCSFFDANGDDYLDLYVSSGSNEFKNGEQYQDRLYINDGKGNFSRSENGLPKIENSTSCVVPFDYDKDGDDDLFIGGFVTENAYPTSGKSWLLKNHNGIFSDQSSFLPNNGEIGIINDCVALSSDRLVVVGEWTDILILNQKKSGHFQIESGNGLENTGGWWNCIESHDFDGDGDLDMVIGNRGLNSMFNASVEHPASIYWGDFDNNNDLDAIPCYYNKTDKSTFPKHGLDQMFMQMKGIRKTFQTYDAYSRATLDQIIMDRSNFLTAEIFESVYIENLGGGKMKVSVLPIQAQFSYVQGILVKDVNNDGEKDIILVGNNFGVDMEVGRSDASHGLVLINSKGKFEALSINESGFSTKGYDSRQIIDINDDLIVVTNNDGPIQFFKIK
jgi:hypothetical protein